MRRFKQQIADSECAEVLTNEKRGFLAVNGEGGYPYALPINYYFDAETGNIYFHGARSGHKFDALKRDSKACFTVCEQGVQKDDWSYHARSVIVFGRIRFIESPDEAVTFVRKMAWKYYPSDAHDEIEQDIAKNAPRMQMLELIPDHITGKLVHEK